MTSTFLTSFARACLAVLAGGLVITGGANAQVPDRLVRPILSQSDATIRKGYADEGYVYKEVLWRESLGCWRNGGSGLGARSICLVCSIDDTSGRPYPSTDKLRGGRPLPSTAVGVVASYAYFQQLPQGWALRRYAPFSANFVAGSREPYHRSNLFNLAMEAPVICEDLQNTSGYE